MYKMNKSKKGVGAWIWIIVIIILIAIIGIGIYFWLNGGSSVGSSVISGNIPQPPALPLG